MSVRPLVLVACAAAIVLPSATAKADNPTLTGSVGKNDAFVIALLDAGGNPVKHLDPGTYTIRVHDASQIHDFHLLGPGVNEATPVEDAVDVTWTVTFQDGTYNFQCDPHANVMHGSFTVGNVTAPPPPTNLKASVGPGRRIALRTASGTKLTVLTGPTKAVITVNDRSRVDNFHLRGPGVNKATGVRFHARVVWRLTLRQGAYVYRSDAHHSLHGTFTVTASG
jgi:plastocyanin